MALNLNLLNFEGRPQEHEIVPITWRNGRRLAAISLDRLLTLFPRIWPDFWMFADLDGYHIDTCIEMSVRMRHPELIFQRMKKALSLVLDCLVPPFHADDFERRLLNLLLNKLNRDLIRPEIEDGIFWGRFPRTLKLFQRFAEVSHATKSDSIARVLVEFIRNEYPRIVAEDYESLPKWSRALRQIQDFAPLHFLLGQNLLFPRVPPYAQGLLQLDDRGGFHDTINDERPFVDEQLLNGLPLERGRPRFRTRQGNRIRRHHRPLRLDHRLNPDRFERNFQRRPLLQYGGNAEIGRELQGIRRHAHVLVDRIEDVCDDFNEAEGRRYGAPLLQYERGYLPRGLLGRDAQWRPPAILA